MASSFDFGYANPSNFSDWATYAGFDRKSGTMAAPSASAGVPPPETFGELYEQKIAQPFGNAMQGVQTFGTNISNAATQLGQGNGMAAVNAARGVNPAQPQKPQQPQQPVGWNLPSHID